MPITEITPLPTPPSRQDPVNFSNRADAFLGALPTFATEVNTVAESLSLFIANGNYTVPVAYAAGVVLSSAAETIEYSGNVYALKFGELPYTLTGTWDTDSAKLRLIQGLTATDLAASDGAAMVGYMPAGTGAVATTVEKQLRKGFVNILDFIPDGTDLTSTNCSPFLQKAIDAAISSDRNLIGCNREFRLEDPVFIKTFQPGFYFDGRGARFRCFNTPISGTSDNSAFQVYGAGDKGVAEAYDVFLQNFTLIAGSPNTNQCGVYFQGRRSRIQNIKFFGGFGVCLQMTGAKESTIDQIHVENYVGSTSTKVGIGLAFRYCLNLQVSNSFVGYCEYGVGQGVSLSSPPSHGNEGIQIIGNAFVANTNQFLNNGLWFNISKNLFDITSANGIELSGQEHVISGNWIADASSETATGFKLLNLPATSSVSINNNVFWRGAGSGGSGSVTAISAAGDRFIITGNIFRGNLLGTGTIAITSGTGGTTIGSNSYYLGAQRITTTGTLVNQSRSDPSGRNFVFSGMSIGNDLSDFGARLSVLAPDGVYAANFVNNVGLTQFRTNVSNHTVGNAWNASVACTYIGKDSATNRSVNAAGTLNANGADYAEYEFNNGLSIAKGDVVGFKSDGSLTFDFSESIRFGIKSTDPAYVGGDTWCHESIVGTQPTMPQKEHGIYIEEDVRKYKNDLELWEKRVEEERKKVDRIAYAGKVPVNVFGAVPGGYIVATQNESGKIVGKFINDPDFSQRRYIVGRVNRELPDGRCEVAVIIS